MLAADKTQLVAGLKKHALEIRQKELTFFMERYTNLATQASIVAGFAFDGLVELEAPDHCVDLDSRNVTAADKLREQTDWQGGLCVVSSLYYLFDAAAMALALYTVCVASFCVVYGHRLALQGPQGSVQKSVAVMMKEKRGSTSPSACRWPRSSWRA